MFEIELTDQAIEDLQWFKKHEQNVILDGIEANLCYEPTTETRNQKRLRPNDTAEWELRLGAYRVLYNVEQTVRIVSIERIAAKQGNKYIESLEDLQEELNLLQAALKKKVLCASDVPAQSVRPKVKRGKSLQAVRQQLGLQSEVAKEGCTNE